MADRLGTYKAKRDFEKTPEPKGARRGSEGRGALRGPGAPRPPAPLGPAARARGRRSPRGRCRAACPTTRTRTAWPCAPRTTRSSTSSSRARSRRASTAPGTMTIWDSGTFEAEKFRDDEVIATFHGERMRGRYALFRTREHRLDDPPDGPAGGPGLRAAARAAQADARAQRQAAAERRTSSASRSSGTASARSRPSTTATSTCGAQLSRLHAALPGGARAGARARLAPDRARRRDRGLRRRGPAELRAAPVADAPGVRLRRAAAHARHPGDLRDLRPPLPRRPLDDLPLSYEERRELLERLELEGPAWRTPAYHRGEGRALLAATKELGIEGIVAKKLDCPYQPGARALRTGSR